MLDLTGKSALVTGGARGIGKAICLTLARQGADIAFVDVGRPEVAQATLEEIQALGRKAVFVPADVTDFAACEGAVNAALYAFGKIDILVNNAGITRDDLMMRMPTEDFEKVLKVNLFGAWYMTKAAIRPMLKARAGRIVNMSSVSGQAGQMGQTNYSSSKAGLIGLTKATAKEVGSRGITCNAIAPGFIVTDLTTVLPDELQEQIKTATPLRHFGEVQDVANAVAFLVSDEAAFITGQVLAVDGGLVMM
jgi:3-oxoacyl-[acyl-carrier protein] reductase